MINVPEILCMWHMAGGDQWTQPVQIEQRDRSPQFPGGPCTFKRPLVTHTQLSGLQKLNLLTLRRVSYWRRSGGHQTHWHWRRGASGLQIPPREAGESRIVCDLKKTLWIKQSSRRTLPTTRSVNIVASSDMFKIAAMHSKYAAWDQTIFKAPIWTRVTVRTPNPRNGFLSPSLPPETTLLSLKSSQIPEFESVLCEFSKFKIQDVDRFYYAVCT